jgi:hypothetical protein
VSSGVVARVGDVLHAYRSQGGCITALNSLAFTCCRLLDSVAWVSLHEQGSEAWAAIADHPTLLSDVCWLMSCPARSATLIDRGIAGCVLLTSAQGGALTQPAAQQRRSLQAARRACEGVLARADEWPIELLLSTYGPQCLQYHPPTMARRVLSELARCEATSGD